MFPAPVLKSSDSVGRPNQPSSSLNEGQKMSPKKSKAAELESYGMRNSTEDAETPPVLEMEGPGEAVRVPLIHCSAFNVFETISGSKSDPLCGCRRTRNHRFRCGPVV